MSITIMLSPKSSLFWLVWVLCFFWSAGHSNMKKSCVATDKQSLLKLKDGFIDDKLGVLSSWKSEVDCCQWSGVSCSNLTGHVIKLTLYDLGGNIDPSLCDLHHLTHLNLDESNFEGRKIPECIGSLGQLRELTMFFTSIGGTVPRGLQNLSNLQTLDLCGSYGLIANDLEWISHLTSLRSLYLCGVNLSRAVDWQSSLSKAPHLSQIHLDNCTLTSNNVNPASFVHTNSSTSLELLSLQYDYLDSSILPWLSNISKVLTDLYLCDNNLEHIFPNTLHINSLQVLELSSNALQLIGPKGFSNMNALLYLDLDGNSLRHIPSDAFTNTTSLKSIDLQNNKLENSMLKSFSNLSRLETLRLSNNNLSGKLSNRISQLRCAQNSIQELDLSDNPFSNGLFPDLSAFSKLMNLNLGNTSLHGSLNETHLSTLSNLRVLRVPQNSIFFNVSSNWVPPFQLEEFSAASCNFGPHFPRWLKYQTSLQTLDISNASISDSIPQSLWLNSFNYLNLSHNRLYGELPKSFLESDVYISDLSFNNLSGPLPYFPPNVTALLLSNNMFSGTISICATFQPGLHYLDISSNVLSGRLPDCWGKLPRLEVLRLEKNHFYGAIPNSLGTLNNLQSIHLNNNKFSGKLPSLMNSSYLSFIDFGNNNLNGKLPSWIGHYLHNLIGLRLRENKLQGSIPTILCNLPHLQILDLSKNNLTGDIPHCFGDLSAMSNMTSPSQAIFYYQVVFNTTSQIFHDKATLSWKGQDADYSKILALLKTIDLSCNRLTGEIPSGITKLMALASLNLSFNNFKGSIPFNMGRMQRLESLDLSNNSLSGEIPISFSNLSFLSVLRLSFNNLSGKIPTATQLQSFNAASYMGNKGLCGPPLIERCPEDGSSYLNPNPSYNMDANGGDNLISFGFYVSLALGFIIGFWGVCGTLILKHSSRHRFFQFFENMNDWIYVHLAILKA